MKLIFISMALIINNFAFAKEKSNCASLKHCIELVSKITQKKYHLDKEINGPVDISKNFQITTENADFFISELLNLNGYTRLPSISGDWLVVNVRDVRYFPVPNHLYSKDNVPRTYDHVMVSFKLKNPHITSEISRNFRPFMSRYGRIIDIPANGTIIISDTGLNAHRLAKFIAVLDKVPTDEEIEQFAKQKKQRHQLKMLEAKNCKDLEYQIMELHSALRSKN